MQGMLTANGQVTGALINGIEPVFENRVSILGDHMIDGSLESLDLAPFSMVVGEQLARGLGLTIGDHHGVARSLSLCCRGSAAL